MALIACRECNESVSDMAKACPKCGCPVRASLPKEVQEAKKEKRNLLLVGVMVGALLLMAFIGVALRNTDVTELSLGILWVVAIVAFVISPIILASRHGKTRGNANTGAVLGFLLGWLGLVIERAVLPPNLDKRFSWKSFLIAAGSAAAASMIAAIICCVLAGPVHQEDAVRCIATGLQGGVCLGVLAGTVAGIVTAVLRATMEARQSSLQASRGDLESQRR